MMTHGNVWRAIDRLAAKHGLSPSGLARRAGLDPTTFNKSKRTSRKGKQRWPSTESIAKILSATGETLGEFVLLVGEDEAAAVARRLPILALSRAQPDANFDPDGRPSGQQWDAMVFPQPLAPDAFALEVTDDRFAPVYREGDLLIAAAHTGLRRGDRVLVGLRGGPVLVGRFIHRGLRQVHIAAIAGGEEDRTLDADRVAWIARILWASQ